MKQKGRVAIFLSGRGSNFEAIYTHSQKADANFEIVAVISDQKDAKGLERAKALNIDAFYISPKKHKSKEAYEQKILDTLGEYNVDLICLAGYMRIVGRTLLQGYAGKIINIHPSLLPAFPGLHAQEQAFEHGVKVSGCTVHFVDLGMDTGPIIKQIAVPVKEDDTSETLSARILKEEHKLYSEVVRLFFENKLKINGRKVIISL